MPGRRLTHRVFHPPTAARMADLCPQAFPEMDTRLTLVLSGRPLGRPPRRPAPPRRRPLLTLLTHRYSPPCHGRPPCRGRTLIPQVWPRGHNHHRTSSRTGPGGTVPKPTSHYQPTRTGRSPLAHLLLGAELRFQLDSGPKSKRFAPFSRGELAPIYASLAPHGPTVPPTVDIVAAARPDVLSETA